MILKMRIAVQTAMRKPCKILCLDHDWEPKNDITAKAVKNFILEDEIDGRGFDDKLKEIGVNHDGIFDIKMQFMLDTADELMPYAYEFLKEHVLIQKL